MSGIIFDGQMIAFQEVCSSFQLPLYFVRKC